ncbi:Protein TONSOKU [Abeliophyllum distichum]|uniref:Protein TONSOKU n=1 Tax=Abeliophyllum distichum TaxID=126358 RepID=A0ABD1SD26_9LAMI
MRQKDEASHQLSAAKRAYKNAAEVGNRQEEARWANMIGDILKNRGEYVEALRWLRVDYDVSVKHLPEKQLLPTCQSLGEVYLRLQHYRDALIYQKKHLELAKDADDIIEQQRASTQLGRTYHDVFMKSDGDHNSVRNAKKYFKSAMKLAQVLKENPPLNKCSFIKEYIDAHNNLGMLEMDLDNFEEAEKFLTRGLQICDEEEVIENDAARSRLHHNLGTLYTELRRWGKAHEHISKDIIICKQIGHRQGEAKGYINLGELHYRNQKYNEAIFSYQKALDLAKSLEDEDALADQIDTNIEIVREAMKVMDELKKEEQNLKKLERNTEMARGMAGERKCLLKQNASLDCLVEKSRTIFLWIKLREYGKKKKRIASELCDKEKLSDSFLVIGESYQKLRKFTKALKWYRKSWETYKSIGSLEGQALAKINIGDILDSDGDWRGALDAFEEGYRIAVHAKLSSVQLSALENIHYSHMIRFDNIEEARKTQLLIDKLKQSENRELDAEDMAVNCCSETETELDDLSPDDRCHSSFSPEKSKLNSTKSKFSDTPDELDEDTPLISLCRPKRNLAKLRTARVAVTNASTKPPELSTQSTSRSSGSLTIGRKRFRVILSDDEGEGDEVHCSSRTVHKCPAEGVATSDEYKTSKYSSSPVHEFQDVSLAGARCSVSACTPVNLEESTCSYKSRISRLGVQDDKDLTFTNTDAAVDESSCGANADNCTDGYGNLFENRNSATKLQSCGDEPCPHITCKIDEDLVHLKLDSCRIGGKLNIEEMKVEVACLYFLQLSIGKRSRGLVPVIQHIKYGGRILESLEMLDALENHSGKGWIEVSVGVMVPKNVMKLYIDCCEALSEPPNLKVLKKLYNLEVSEDEVVVSDCGLQDISVAPLLNALQAHKTVAVLDLSHNLLGNGTVEKFKQVFTSSGQSYGGLVLDLHSNRLGPTALFHICECPVLYARLEVLDISGNRLTDACASYLSTILRTCKALYSLNIENCSITSRTIQKVADSLDSESVLTNLCLGYNYPVSGNAMVNLFLKLATLKRFQELNVNGIKLSKPVLDSLRKLAKECCLSGLMLGNSNIGNDGAIQLMKSLYKEAQELVKLDLSYCGLTCDYIVRLSNEVSLISGILELNLGGNPIMHEGGNALVSLLTNPQCCLKVLVVCKCQLGLVGVIQILKALSENISLEELNLAENVSQDEIRTLPHDFSSVNENSNSLQKDLNQYKSLFKALQPDEVQTVQQESSAVNTNENQLEVADSEDDLVGVEATLSGLEDSRISLFLKKAFLSECQFTQELVAAIKVAGQLQLLDLSQNEFSKEVGEMLYTAWSSGARAGVAQRHIEENTVHLLVNGKKCCSIKSCCKRI